jgi:isopenicillin N synthase-like dioxygenase
MVKAFYAQAKQFFSLPVEVKRKYEVPGLAGQRGYTSFGKEHAKQSRVADLKEFYQIGQEVDDSDPIKSEYPDNVMTQDCPEFTQAIALDLGLDVDYFKDKIHHGNSILRAIHYPPIIQEPDSAIRSEQHEDINLITLLVGASAGGLQVLTKDNQWLDVVTAEDEIVVNVGDMLQRLTNNVLKSTTHRVVNPPKESWHVPRLSIPFFLHPRSTMDLSCLEHCITKDHPKQYEPITAGEYLSERLMEIGLKK